MMRSWDKVHTFQKLLPGAYRSTLICGALLSLTFLAACEARSSVERQSAQPVAPSESTSPERAVDAPAEPPQKAPEHLEVMPSQVDRPQVIVMMHGYNSNQRDFTSIANLAASKKLAALSLKAPIQNAPERYQWERDDIEATHAYVQQALATAFAEQDVQRSPVWLMGFSQGGMYAALLRARYPESYLGALAIAPAGWASVPDEGCPKERVANVVVVTGEAERPKFAAKTAKVEAFLKRCGLHQETLTHAGGHSFPRDWPVRFGDLFHTWASTPGQGEASK